MTDRDRFAAAALAGMLSGPTQQRAKEVAESAWGYADAMLAARGEDQPAPELPRAPYWADIAFFGHHSYTGKVSEEIMHGQRLLRVEEFCPQGHLLRSVMHAPSAIFEVEYVAAEYAKKHHRDRVCRHPEHVGRCGACGTERPLRIDRCPRCDSLSIGAPGQEHAPQACWNERQRDALGMGTNACTRKPCEAHHKADPCAWPVCPVHKPQARDGEEHPF